ncbi:Phenylalanine--tRNA ligase alpha subunit protein [Marine Group I thaumarchaeote SCGC RSA3]|uniref:phenylalanine--tRNA ligase n=3 Tax=Marine Group I TaxID=905826 RepID=A0A081RNQ5_9ARCH|nr:Phenylalanine--tRNA ligase alpha subunit protein [Marine Group I thaumarchaeote SCGC AAA799-N04]KFM15212.1 Phenylalanine--tRNA ligase alpha subunit protein [Marine Group I thaumarchaeote SCGC AAA799-D11]KFM16491.1 Phenylalanine--tRNA ligase alpha subunit protein [Marine Group I thaumarchaeote SCGC RSA3]
MLSQVFHDIEKKIITSLKDNPKQTPEILQNSTGLSPDQIRRGIEWLKLKELANVDESKSSIISLGKNGKESLEKGLPERRLLDLLENGPKKLNHLQKELGPIFGPAMGLCKKNNWIETTSDQVSSIFASNDELPGEKTLKQIGNEQLPKSLIDADDLSALLKRPDFVVEEIVKTKQITLTDSAKSINLDASSGGIDVEAKVPEVFVARTHPLKDTIDEIREIFVTLGFSEIYGNMTQSSFWNFDALFTPQDHPARELQDTFYLDGISAKKIATADQIKKVSESHKKNWRYQWDINEARKMVLRTHTTCVTIKHLAETKPDEARVFSLGRVFRNEKVSYKHLVEFNQIEGVVVGKDANLRNLMGIQREFYKRIGITKIKFWPTFFPYTEPSLQTMVYNERLGKWVELFGMGIFRPEVTKPLGITKPVLAWGGGIERIAMLKYSLDDVREFYNNNLSWLRSATKCQ